MKTNNIARCEHLEVRGRMQDYQIRELVIANTSSVLILNRLGNLRGYRKLSFLGRLLNIILYHCYCYSWAHLQVMA